MKDDRDALFTIYSPISKVDDFIEKVYLPTKLRYKYSDSLRGEYDFTLDVKWVILFTSKLNYDNSR